MLDALDFDYAALIRPFDPAYLELRPGATTKDKTRCLGLLYADVRAYQERLDQVVGTNAWGVRYTALSSAGTVVALECVVTIDGMPYSKAGTGHELATDPNSWAKADAMAFKRACSAYGLGRYLYSAPPEWFEYDDAKRSIPNQADKIALLYRKMSIKPQDWMLRTASGERLPAELVQELRTLRLQAKQAGVMLEPATMTQSDLDLFSPDELAALVARTRMQIGAIIG